MLSSYQYSFKLSFILCHPFLLLEFFSIAASTSLLADDIALPGTLKDKGPSEL
uniref:Uncharacterized protein n=1 Tax=Amphimedon queenslandica TaxID=400682 RepID=A0A1X7UDT9_AMPQE